MQNLTARKAGCRGALLAIAACLVLLPPEPARADSANEDEQAFYGAILTARGTGKVTRFRTVEVQTEDDRSEYADLIPVIEKGLATRDLEVARRGDLVLRVRFRTTTGDEKDPEDPNFRIEGRTGTTGSSRMQMTLRLRKGEKAEPVARLHMTFELYEPGAPPLWTAQVVGPDDHAARTHLLVQMTEGAMSKLGESGQFRISFE